MTAAIFCCALCFRFSLKNYIAENTRSSLCLVQYKFREELRYSGDELLVEGTSYTYMSGGTKKTVEFNADRSMDEYDRELYADRAFFEDIARLDGVARFDLAYITGYEANGTSGCVIGCGVDQYNRLLCDYPTQLSEKLIVAEGAEPGEGECMITSYRASEEGLRIGDVISVEKESSPAREFRISGIIAFVSRDGGVMYDMGYERLRCYTTNPFFHHSSRLNDLILCAFDDAYALDGEHEVNNFIAWYELDSPEAIALLREQEDAGGMMGFYPASGRASRLCEVPLQMTGASLGFAIISAALTGAFFLCVFGNMFMARAYEFGVFYQLGAPSFAIFCGVFCELSLFCAALLPLGVVAGSLFASVLSNSAGYAAKLGLDFTPGVGMCALAAALLFALGTAASLMSVRWYKNDGKV